jgi:hypothetical protein
MILFAVALNVPNPRQHTQETHKHKEKYPNQLKETASGSTTICTAMKVKWLSIYSLMNEEGTFCSGTTIKLISCPSSCCGYMSVTAVVSI